MFPAPICCVFSGLQKEGENVLSRWPLTSSHNMPDPVCGSLLYFCRLSIYIQFWKAPGYLVRGLVSANIKSLFVFLTSQNYFIHFPSLLSFSLFYNGSYAWSLSCFDKFLVTITKPWTSKLTFCNCCSVFSSSTSFYLRVAFLFFDEKEVERERRVEREKKGNTGF